MRPQDAEFMDAVAEAFAERSEELRKGFEQDFMTDNVDRYADGGEECFFSVKQWAQLHRIAKERFGIDVNDYV